MAEWIDAVITEIGAIFVIVGGVFLMGAVSGLLIWLLSVIWIEASNKWRAILRAESLIYEYKQNRSEFLEWKENRNV